MKRNQVVMLFFLINLPAWILYFTWGQGVRLYTVFLAFCAMWSLWTARRDRQAVWTQKMRDIWRIQMLWCVAAVEGNSELFYRAARPSVAVLLVCGICGLTIKSVFEGDKYTINQP